jgi:UDP-galactopyranose mutase
MNCYDYLVVGSGLFGAVFAYKAKQAGKKCLVLDRRSHLGGNVYCENIAGINLHKYGAHIFHTNNKRVWDFVNLFVSFNRYTNAPLANYRGRLYNLPFNMNTFYALWGVTTPSEARRKIEQQKKLMSSPIKSLEDHALATVGKDIYETLIKEYTEKQWGRKCAELPAFIIKRLPVRFTFDNNYFNDNYQGVPMGGYNILIDGLLKDIETRTDTSFLDKRRYWEGLAGTVVYTGPIDEFYAFRFGKLEYRSLRFETETLDCENYQGNAVINYTDSSTPYTRIIEHKHFEFGTQPKTVISREYPIEWHDGAEPFYPVNNEKNDRLYERYRAIAAGEKNTIFGGRLAEYKYYNMDEVIERALLTWENHH